MKGQRLFVRRTTADDSATLRDFYARESVTAEATMLDAEGLLGKVAGEPVAHLAFSRSGETIHIESLYVAAGFRRRGIGRWLLRELEETARGLKATALETSLSVETKPFFEAAGFTASSGVLRKVIPN